MSALIRVWPKSDSVRKHIKHPTAGGFTDDKLYADWPRDQFTFRRIRDGDVSTTDPNQPTAR